MPNPRPAAERTIPLDCPHLEARELYVCYECAAANLDAYARQQVEAFRERVRNTVEECGAVGDHDDDYYHGYDQAIQDAVAAIRALCPLTP